CRKLRNVRDGHAFVLRYRFAPSSRAFILAPRTLRAAGHLVNPGAEGGAALGAAPGDFPPGLRGEGRPPRGFVRFVVPPLDRVERTVLEQSLLPRAARWRLRNSSAVSLAGAAEADVAKPLRA